MDSEQGIKFSSEPDESLVPAVITRFGLLLGRLDGVVPSPLPCGLPGPLGTGRRRDGWGKGDSKWGRTLRSRMSE